MKLSVNALTRSDNNQINISDGRWNITISRYFFLQNEKDVFMVNKTNRIYSWYLIRFSQQEQQTKSSLDTQS